jgi:hypothetical protein
MRQNGQNNGQGHKTSRHLLTGQRMVGWKSHPLEVFISFRTIVPKPLSAKYNESYQKSTFNQIVYMNESASWQGRLRKN